jgi:hypothetical protein
LNLLDWVGWFVQENKTEPSLRGFAEAIQDGTIISQHGVYGPKVILMPNGDYIKVFNPKSGFTKRHFFPKYKTFIKNAQRLNQIGIPCVEIKEVFLTENKSYAVRYKPLEGTDLRTLAQRDPHTTLLEFIPFLVSLHEKGIYFRGIHLANVLKLNDGSYGLIDRADLYFKRPPLSIFTRARNLAHLIKNKDDKPFYQQFDIEKFVEGYLKKAGIKGLSARFLKFHTESVQK